VILWAILTGGLIYKSASSSDKRFLYLTKGIKGINELLHLDEITDMPPLLIHLLSKMLGINVENRYTIEEVMAHPWMGMNSQSSSHMVSKLKSKNSDVITLESSSPTRLIDVSTSPSLSSSSSTESFENQHEHKQIKVAEVNSREKEQHLFGLDSSKPMLGNIGYGGIFSRCLKVGS